MSSQDPETRYELLIEQAVAREELWSLLAPSGLIRFRLQDGTLALPLWPGQEEAALEATDASEQPYRIPLEELLERLLPELVRQGCLVAAFPLAGAARIVHAGDVSTRLLQEWEEEP
jgi:hypothetical protein